MIATYPAITGPDGHLAHRRHFVGHSMMGLPGFWPRGGDLNGKPELALYQDQAAMYGGDGVLYTVVSYETPVAWITWTDDVYVLERRFSATTSRHQNYCRVWLPIHMARLRRVRTDLPDLF